MEVIHVILLILGLVVQVMCDNSDSGTTTTPSEEISTETSNNSTETLSNSTESSNTSTEAEKPEVEPRIGIQGLYGGWYYNYQAKNPNNIHYVYGTYQTPLKNYYHEQHYYQEGGSDETFNYYLNFGLSKMTDDNFQYHDFHHFYHDINRTIGEQDTIQSEFIILCHPNATFLCPESTETICLMNGTIYCMSLIATVVPCVQNESTHCVKSVVPCVKNCVNNFEDISLPCLSNVTIVDVYEDIRGKTTLNRVGGTFIVVDALEETERTYCVTVIVDPRLRETEDQIEL